jgi:ABC-type lipoprotein export system ATPase subunit
MHSDAPAVRITNLARTYHAGGKPVNALRGVSLAVQSGTFVTLEGRSGSGKTTLLNILGGLDQATSGNVELFGQPLNALSQEQLTRLRRERLGFIFQSFALLPILTAWENIEVPLRINGSLPRHERAARVNEVAELVGIGAWATHRPPEMSGGQQQRVAIARALVSRPQLLLADEPTGQLDSTTGRAILHLLRDIVRSTGVTLVMTTHDPSTRAFADITYHMEDGQLVEMVEEQVL